MPSTTTTPNERQFSSNPHDWLFGQVKGGSASHFDDVYGDYYIGPRKPLVVCPPPPPPPPPGGGGGPPPPPPPGGDGGGGGGGGDG